MTEDPRIAQYEQEYAAGVEIAHKAMISSYIGPPPKLRGDAERMVAALLVAGWTPPTPTVQPVEYVIWSNEHRAWGGPNQRGYTPFLEDAGRYPHDVAARICEGANIVQNEHVPDGYRSEVMIPDPASQLPALEQAAPQLHAGRQARQVLENALGVPHAAGGIDALSMTELARRVAAEIERLRKALTEKTMSNGQTVAKALEVTGELEDQIVALRTEANRHRVLRQRNDLLARGLAQRVGRLRAELADARQAANAAQNLADTWEREHQNTVLPYTTQIEAERDAVLAEVASLRAQLARAFVFPEDWQQRITDLPGIGALTLARLAEEIDLWAAPNKGKEATGDH